jgi:hypothetical protein
MKVESFFPGRIRISSPLLAKPKNLDQARLMLASIDGIQDISVTQRAGSATILYDPARLSVEMLMSAREEIEKLEKAMTPA